MVLNLNLYKTPEQLAEELATQLMSWIENSPNPLFHMAISGGKTPDLLFRALAENYPDWKHWHKVHFWWVDERMVSPDDAESNYGKVYNTLFSKNIIPKENIHRIKGENDPLSEAKSYSRQIAEKVPMQDGWPTFDLILLGMGEDGHTASIFPDQMHLLESPRACEVATHPQSGQKRVTLSGSTINHALKVCFLVTGPDKAEKLMEVATNHENAKRLPAAHIHPLNDELAWYIDEAAAREIRDKMPV
ncbi:MAG TPA: 6-phosphogluconolactonase [Prolixibacteraceae bacterium]|nr:6-phosphogluconolactonase [Prolixibacteraceae bacterium]